MKLSQNIRVGLFLSIILVLLIGCNKEEEVDEIYQLSKSEEIKIHLSEISADSLESYVRWLENMGTRYLFANNHRDVALSIKNKFLDFGYNNAYLDSFSLTLYCSTLMKTVTTWQYNVVATLNGHVYPDSIYIMGGHYDCINNTGDSYTYAPGANDNASGVATTLEVARIMKYKNFKSRSTIRFIIFAAEEAGFYGSWDYSNKASVRGDKISMMLNNDMVAYWPGIEPGRWTLNIIDYPNSGSLQDYARLISSQYTTLLTTNDNTYSQYSDSYPFAQNDYKAVFFITNADDPNYHTDNDIADECNFEFCREVAKINHAILMELNM